MFVTCHISFGQLSNFVGSSFEVTRTIRSNKLHFTWGCSILLLKKIEEGPETGFLFYFFNDSDIFLSILILIITSLAIHYFQNIFRGFSILVYIGVQVLFRSFFHFLLLPSHVTRSRTCLALTSVWPKNTEKFRLFCRFRPLQWS